MPYPAVFQFARKIDASEPVVRDAELAEAIGRYVEASHEFMRDLDLQIRRISALHENLIVWGTGQLTMKLLSDSCLSAARITAFVDGNPIHHGRVIRGVAVVSGADLRSSSTPILICSLINATAIRAAIRDLGLTNPVFSLSRD
jgi:hypothetical protein